MDQPVICDTCGKPAAEVKRVVLENGYNKANARPLYNCPECYKNKNNARRAASSASAAKS